MVYTSKSSPLQIGGHRFKKKIMDGSIDLYTNTVKVMLVTSSYTPNQDAHDFRNDVTNEASGTGYTAGGKAVWSQVSRLRSLVR